MTKYMREIRRYSKNKKRRSKNKIICSKNKKYRKTYKNTKRKKINKTIKRKKKLKGGSFKGTSDTICSDHTDSKFSKIFFSDPDNYNIDLKGKDIEKYDNIVFINKHSDEKIFFSHSKYISEGQFGKIDLYSSDGYGDIVLKTEINDPSIFDGPIERELAKSLLNNGCNTIQEYSIPDPDMPVIAKYKCIKKSQIRAGFEFDSDKKGILTVGTIIDAYEIIDNELGVKRVRYSEGWVSEKTSAGVMLLEKIYDKVYYYLLEPGVMDLKTLVTSKQSGSTDPLIDSDTFKRIIESIIIDLKCLLKKGYYYTDLKLENILVVCDTNRDYRVKLGDIGSMVTLKDKGIWAQDLDNDKFLYTFCPPFVTFSYDDNSGLDSKINRDKLYIILWNIGIMYLYYYFINIEPPDKELDEEYIRRYISDKTICDNILNPAFSHTFHIPFKYLTHDKEVMDEIIEEDGWLTGGPRPVTYSRL